MLEVDLKLLPVSRRGERIRFFSYHLGKVFFMCFSVQSWCFTLLIYFSCVQVYFICIPFSPTNLSYKNKLICQIINLFVFELKMVYRELRNDKLIKRLPWDKVATNPNNILKQARRSLFIVAYLRAYSPFCWHKNRIDFIVNICNAVAKYQLCLITACSINFFFSLTLKTEVKFTFFWNSRALLSSITQVCQLIIIPLNKHNLCWDDHKFCTGAATVEKCWFNSLKHLQELNLIHYIPKVFKMLNQITELHLIWLDFQRLISLRLITNFLLVTKMYTLLYMF